MIRSDAFHPRPGYCHSLFPETSGISSPASYIFQTSNSYKKLHSLRWFYFSSTRAVSRWWFRADLSGPWNARAIENTPPHSTATTILRRGPNVRPIEVYEVEAPSDHPWRICEVPSALSFSSYNHRPASLHAPRNQRSLIPHVYSISFDDSPRFGSTRPTT